MADVVELNTASLVACERVIEEGLSRFEDAGKALAKVRDECLFKLNGFETFEAYCRERWAFSKQRAYELIRASAAVSTVRHAVLSIEPPANARQAVELAKLPEDQQAAAWIEIKESAPNEGVTTKHVATAVKARLKKQRKEEPVEEPPEEEPKPSLRLVPPVPEKAPSKRTLERTSRDEKIVELHNRGMSPLEIAAELGVRRHCVQNSKRRLGLIARRSPLRGLIDAAIEGSDTWEDALTQTAERWDAACPEELEELVARLEQLASSARAMIRALKKHADRRTD